ncbi:hypothetical protein BDV32DRAFT_118880 [Aspergillus pseudonomiae]|nr:hypothetical protein BDV32DRAFT_118880 [Aspergillus pseudonomiae]
MDHLARTADACRTPLISIQGRLASLAIRHARVHSSWPTISLMISIKLDVLQRTMLSSLLPNSRDTSLTTSIGQELPQRTT